MFFSLPSRTPQEPSDSGTGILAPDLSKQKTHKQNTPQCDSNIKRDSHLFPPESKNVSPTYLAVTFNVYVTFDHRAKRSSHPADRASDSRQGQLLRPDHRETATELHQEEQKKINQNKVHTTTIHFALLRFVFFLLVRFRHRMYDRILFASGDQR